MSSPTPPLGAGGVGAVAGRFLDTMFGDMIRGGGIIARTEVAISADFIKSITADAFDSMVEGEPNVNVGMTAEGLTEVVERFMRTVAYASMILTDEIAEEFYSEMIQEGFSNAVQTSVGGAFQSILNTWRGGYPLNYDEIEDVGQSIEDLDADMIGMLTAQAGSNIPTSYFRLKRGLDRYVDDRTIALRSQLAGYTDRMNDLVMWLHDRGQSISQRTFDFSVLAIREAYERAIRIIDDASERALSRLQELLAELKTVQSWLEWTNEHPETPLISTEEARLVAIENQKEAEATIQTYNRILTSIDSALSTFDIDLSTLIGKIDTVIGKVIEVYNSMVDKANEIDLSEQITKLNQAIKILLAYRNAIDSSSDFDTSVGWSVRKRLPTLRASDAITIVDSAILSFTGVNRISASDTLEISDSLSLTIESPAYEFWDFLSEDEITNFANNVNEFTVWESPTYLGFAPPSGDSGRASRELIGYASSKVETVMKVVVSVNTITYEDYVSWVLIFDGSEFGEVIIALVPGSTTKLRLLDYNSGNYVDFDNPNDFFKFVVDWTNKKAQVIYNDIVIAEVSIATTSTTDTKTRIWFNEANYSDHITDVKVDKVIIY